MRAFYAFVILIVSFGLWVLPVTEGVYDFRTDIRSDTFNDTVTGAVATSSNVTLFTAVYLNDTETISVTSSLATDTPLFSTYNTTSRQTLFTGLTANTTRNLTVSYDIDSLTGANAFDTFLDWFPYIWIMIIVAFPIAALAAVFMGRL